MKKVMLVLILTLLFISVFHKPAANAAVDNCIDCHHINFQLGTIDRPTVCVVCHNVSMGWNSPDSINSDYDTIHITRWHKGGSVSPTIDQRTGCWVCHFTDLSSTVRRVGCKTCHTNVPHENHGHVSASDWVTDGLAEPPPNPPDDGHGYIQRTFSCINSNCHGNYGAIVKKPKCTNCHTDPHGPFPGTADETGVLVSPNASNPTTQSDIAVKWLYQSGDSLKKSLDGLNWTSLDIGTPAPGSNYTYTDPGILNWSIVYYKITRSDSSEKYFPVYPPGSNAHTNYLDNTELCASCHTTHSADQAKLLKEETIEDLCRTCHGLANVGSRYNVDTGEIVVAGSIDSNGLITAIDYRRSNSGAFGIFSGGNYYAGNHVNTWNGAQVTSSHSTNSNVSSLAPGGGHNRINLTCTSCHHSHPKKNAFRLLNIGTVEAYAVNPDAAGERINYIKNTNTGCGCHQQFKAPQNSGHEKYRDSYRHAMGISIQGPYVSNNIITGQPWSLTTNLPTEYKVYYDGQFRVAGTLSGAASVQYVENGGVSCSTCHYAHGTTVTGTNLSSVDLNGDTILNDYSTMLKRKKEMEVCQDCHKK